MKKSSIKIKIPLPCPKKWSKMIPVDQGAFCKSCERIVVDFTAMSDQELINYFQKYNDNLCGRFKKDQVNRSINSLLNPSKSTNYAASSILVAGLLLSGTASAQEPFKIGEVAVEQQINEVIILKGKVTERESGEPVPFGSIGIYDVNNTFIIGTETDFDGNYSIEIPAIYKNQKIHIKVEYVGLTGQSVGLDLKTYDNSNLDFQMIPGLITIEPPIHQYIPLIKRDDLKNINPPIIIKGVVQDEEGEPLIAASISLEEINITTSTNIDGTYELSIPQKYKEKTIKLITTYTGYEDVENEINLSKYNNESFDITMNEGYWIGEIVIASPFQRFWWKIRSLFSKKQHRYYVF